MKVNRTCMLCKTEYTTCTDKLKFSSFLEQFCNINHYTILNILNDYCNKNITIAEAKEKLSKCKLDGYEKFSDKYRILIDKIINHKENYEVNYEKDSNILEENDNQINNSQKEYKKIFPSKKNRKA